MTESQTTIATNKKEQRMSETDYKQIMLDLFASLTLCDNMGDVCGDVQEAMDRIGIKCYVDLSDGDGKDDFLQVLKDNGAKYQFGGEIEFND